MPHPVPRALLLCLQEYLPDRLGRVALGGAVTLGGALLLIKQQNNKRLEFDKWLFCLKMSLVFLSFRTTANWALSCSRFSFRESWGDYEKVISHEFPTQK